MAKTQVSRKNAKKKEQISEAELPQRINYIILVVGVVTVIVGYLVMSSGDAVSSLSVTIAPLILALGYCVIIPFGIIYKKKSKANDQIS